MVVHGLMPVALPEGVQPGEKYTARLDNGEKIVFEAPPNATAGMLIQVDVPPARVRRASKKDDTRENLLQQLSAALHARSTDIRSIFLKADVSRTGSVTPSDLNFALQSVGIALSPEELRALVMRFDAKGDHQLDYNELLRWLEPRACAWATTSELAASAVGRAVPDGPVATPPPTKAQQQQRLLALIKRKLLERGGAREAFLDADADRSGQLSFGEFKERLAMLGLPLSDKQVSEVLRPFDRQKTSTLDFSEFSAFLSAHALAPGEEQEELQSARTQMGLMRQAAAGAQPQLSDSAALRAARAAYAASIREAVDDAADDAKVIGVISRKIHEKRWRLMEAFRTFDRAGRGDGRIRAAEFKQALGGLGLAISHERLQALIDAFDVEGDGQLCYYEFVRMISGGGSGTGTDAGAAAMATHGRSVSEVHEADEQKQHKRSALTARVEARLGPLPTAPGEEAAIPAAVPSSEAQLAASILQEFQDLLFAEERSMRQTFMKMDSSGSKGVAPKELKRGLHSLDIEISLADAQRLVRRFDASGTGELSLGEFVRMVQSDPERA